MPTKTEEAIRNLADLVPRMREMRGFGEVLATLKRGGSAGIDGAWGSSCALVAAALATEAPSTLLVVLPRINDVDDFALDVANFLGVSSASSESPPVSRSPQGSAPPSGRRLNEAGRLNEELLVFPAWETLPQDQDVSDAVFGGRLRVLRALDERLSLTRRVTIGHGVTNCSPKRKRGPIGHSAPRVIVTSMPALLQPVPARRAREESTRVLRVGDELEVEPFLRWLVERGFARVPAIEVPGEFSMHGGIVDLYPPDAEDPLRIELFGDEIESIRRFDVETQRKIEDLQSATLTLVAPVVASRERELPGSADNPQANACGSPESLIDSLPPDAWVVLGELQELVDEGKNYLARLHEPRGLFSVPSVLSRCSGFPTVSVAAVAGDFASSGHLAPGEYTGGGRRLEEGRRPAVHSRRAKYSREGRYDSAADENAAATSRARAAIVHLQIESIERFTGPKTQVIEELASAVAADEQVLIACHNEGERDRLAELLQESAGWLGPERSDAPSPTAAGGSLRSTPATPRVQLCLGHVSRGFRMIRERLVVLSDNELFGRAGLQRVSRRKKTLETRAIDSFLDLREGDLVVHLTNGIARYRGMKMLEKDGHTEEHLVLEFRGGVKVYVPVSLIHLVQKYVGSGKAAPELSKLGGTAWAKRKQRAAESVKDLASDMLRLQAQRASRPGICFPPDTHWQREFEAAFPYTETDDQLHAIVDLKGDMERARPMDRLVCGDVGYGKTEVAMRGAFKAIEAGRQVAVLVPTTVLAEQHFRTFSERMAEYPITIEVLSRFKTKAEQREILKRMKQGAVDLVIGTHRLIQHDVQFKDLGLLIIDEEQRFGVEAKETLKQLRLEVDVLTMTATPIPRTLHMAVLGVRDISNLTTPPQDRQSITTRICRFDGELIRNAVVRELNRGGQVYFVHNRVYNIQSVADRIQQIVPEATIGIGHGQMREHDLERAMLEFVSGKTDVLVCTTIIESGLDIPNANTIFIHQAGNYGLADLHQLRGRVGRYKQRAYCYLVLEEGRTLTPQASKRLKAIEEFSELGAGFKIAMRDLEIRGAGNILGTEQSGHIAAVGYELYCRLLENAVRALKKEPLREHRHVAVDLPVTAFLPSSYVPPGRHKIEMYRKLSGVASEAELQELADEFRDRFGPMPVEARRLFELKELQLAAQRWQIDDIHLEGRYAVFGYRHPGKIRELAKLCGSELRIVDESNAYLVLDGRRAGDDDLPRCLKSVLQPV